jgi:multiple sugar transport system ATP-binding protein
VKVVVEELSKQFAGNVQAVDHINLDIPDGEFTVFLGPSGCGKTTTLRMIAGLERPDGGRIFIGDQLVNDVPPKHRRVAMVFQNFALYPSMTVYDNIAFPLEVRKLSKQEIDQRVREAARLVGVEALLSRRPRQVSGGEAQRAALARALVRDPDVFLMDEPLSNLDAKLRVQLRTEIKRLHQETRTTTIYVTHDQEEAMTLGDKIVVMSQGQVQQIGTPYDVFFKPTNIFVAGFVGSPSMNLLDGTLRREAELMVELPGFAQPIPDRFVARLHANGHDTVKWGIRPEHIKLTDGSGGNDVPGQLEVIEPLGSRQLLFVRAGTEVFTVIEDATIPHLVGENCHLCFDDKHVHLFESKTGQSLTG